MIFRRKRDPIKALTARQPKTLKMAVADYMQHYPDAEIKVIAQGRQKQRVAGYIPISQAAEHIDRIEELIKDEFGGGDYRLVLYDPVGNQYGTYNVGVMGKSNFTQLDEAGQLRGSDGKFLQEIGIESIKSAMNPAGQLEGLAKVMQALQPPREDSFQKELMSVMLNNWFTDKENQFEKLQQAMEMVKALQPTVQPEDPTTAIITAFAPLLTQMIAARQGGGANPVLQQLMQNPQIAQAMQAQLAGGEQATPQLPEPGEQDAPQLSEPGEQMQKPDPQGESTPPSPVNAAVESFRAHIRGGATAEKLTPMFLGMVGLARAWEPGHELFADFIDETDWDKLAEAFDKFCGAIPELAQNAELQQQMKIAIATMLLTQGDDYIDQETREDQNAKTEPDQDGEWPDEDRELGEEIGGELESALAGDHVPGG